MDTYELTRLLARELPFSLSVRPSNAPADSADERPACRQKRSARRSQLLPDRHHAPGPRQTSTRAGVGARSGAVPRMPLWRPCALRLYRTLVRPISGRFIRRHGIWIDAMIGMRKEYRTRQRGPRTVANQVFRSVVARVCAAVAQAVAAPRRF